MVKKPKYILIYENTCEVKSSVMIVMATKEWKCLRPRPACFYQTDEMDAATGIKYLKLHSSQKA